MAMALGLQGRFGGARDNAHGRRAFKGSCGVRNGREEVDLSRHRSLCERLLAVGLLSWPDVPKLFGRLRLLEVDQNRKRLRRKEVVIHKRFIAPHILSAHDDVLARRREVRLDQAKGRVVKREAQRRRLEGEEETKQRQRHTANERTDLCSQRDKRSG